MKRPWNELCDGIGAFETDCDFSGALDLLQDYYDRFDVPLDYRYYYLKANILVEKYHDFGRPTDTDSSCKLEAEKAIDVCRQYAEDEDDSILYLEQKLKKAEISVSYCRKMDLLWDKIDTLRNPDQVVTTSKVDDVLIPNTYLSCFLFYP